jgi:DNA-binding transcriptional MerR regulator
MELIMAIYMIGDLARITGLSKHTLNYYLKLELFQPVEQSKRSRYRYFDESTVERLNNIIKLRKQGMPIKLIQRKLAEEG